MPDQAPDTTMKAGTGEVVPGHNDIFTDIAAQVIMTHIEATPGHDTGIIATSPGVAHNAQVPHTWVTAIYPATTHHIDPTADHPHRSSSSYHSRDQSRSCSHPSYKSSRRDLHRSHSSRSQSKPHHKRNPRVKMEDPHMDYYSSDDRSSNAGEETDHLN